MRRFWFIFFYCFLRPVCIAALIINGIPPTIRAVASAIATVVKALGR